MTLPIRKLTLYKHGISVVERGGAATGERATLTFHRDQMNDVLKSLVAFDVAGGQVRNIAYDAPEDRETKLARGSIHLSDDRSLLDLLRDLRGRAVRVQVSLGEAVQPIEGTVVGLDVGDHASFVQGRLSLLTAQGVRVLKLRDIVGVELLDPQANTDLDFFLRMNTAEPEQRTVTLRLSDGEHDLVVRYLAPSPTWRVSYRFVGAKEENGERRALLQGWGIFDNPFDEALENVRISLVSGMPISFIYDLYTPFTPQRPEVKEEARVAAAPVMMERAERSRKMAAPPAPGMMAAPATRSMDFAAMAGEVEESAAYDMRAGLATGTEVAAQGEAQGDLFEYRIGHPVTVQRGEAAMVPILGTEIPYRKEHVYNGQKMPRHPVVVLRFDNTSGLTLERGPITAIENDNYLGEAIFPFTRPNAEVLLAIAVDLGVSVREERTSHRETHQITLHREYLVFHEYTTQTTAYEVSNSNAEAVELLIEHPRQNGFALLETPDPTEKTENHYRWKVPVPAGPDGHAKFTMRERRLDQRYEQLAALTHDNLSRYLHNKWLDQALGNELQALLKLYADKQRLQKRLGEIDQERNRLMSTQEQARKNMSGLKETGDEGALRARYVRQLNEAEDVLASLEAERQRLLTEDGSLDKQIQAFISNLK